MVERIGERAARSPIPERLESSHDGAWRHAVHAAIAAVPAVSSNAILPGAQARSGRLDSRAPKKASDRKHPVGCRRTPGSARANTAASATDSVEGQTLTGESLDVRYKLVAFPADCRETRSRRRAASPPPRNSAGSNDKAAAALRTVADRAPRRDLPRHYVAALSHTRCAPSAHFGSKDDLALRCHFSVLARHLQPHAQSRPRRTRRSRSSPRARLTRYLLYRPSQPFTAVRAVERYHETYRLCPPRLQSPQTCPHSPPSASSEPRFSS